MKKKVFILLFHNPWEWTADYSTQIALELSKKYVVVVMLLGNAKSLKELFFSQDKRICWSLIHSQLYTYTPLYFIPFRRLRFVENINLILNMIFFKVSLEMRAFFRRADQHYIWASHPSHNMLLRLLGNKGKVIYDCVDYFIGTNREETKCLRTEEVKLIRNSTFFFVNSKSLYNRFVYIRKAIITQQGYSVPKISQLSTRLALPQGKRPIVGYVGGINYRLDYKLLDALIKRNTHIDFVFVGPIQKLNENDFRNLTQKKINSLFNNSNCHHYFEAKKDELPTIIRSFDICMIPYNARLDFNKYSYPAKVFDYFYVGKPVVSTDILELRRFPDFINIGSSAEQWTSIINNLLSKPWSDSNVREQKNLAIENSWEKKMGTIFRIIGRGQ